MISKKFLLFLILALGSLVPVPQASANPLLWSGPVISYSQPAPDPTKATNQDRLTGDIWLTRGRVQGLFNAFSETAYAHNASPQNTEWSYGLLTNYALLSYTNWESLYGGAGGGGPANLIGQAAVLHLISDDIYLSIKFTGWGGSSGGFSYDRSTPTAVPEPSTYALLLIAGIVLVLSVCNRKIRS